MAGGVRRCAQRRCAGSPASAFPALRSPTNGCLPTCMPTGRARPNRVVRLVPRRRPVLRDADARVRRPAGRPGNTDDVWRLMADVRLAEGETLTEQQILDRIRQLLTERTGLTEVRIRDAKWTSVFRIHRRLADAYRDGRIVLAGDAAHVHSPFGGQGMNTGIGDAENLAWKLALVVQGRADEALLDTYEAERRPLAAEVLRNTTTNTRVLLGEGALGRLLRDRVLTPITRLPCGAAVGHPGGLPAVGELPPRTTGLQFAFRSQAPPRRPRGGHRMRTQRWQCHHVARRTRRTLGCAGARPWRGPERRSGGREGAGALRRHSRPHPAQRGRRDAGATRRPPRLARPLGQRRTWDTGWKAHCSTGVPDDRGDRPPGRRGAVGRVMPGPTEQSWKRRWSSS